MSSGRALRKSPRTASPLPGSTPSHAPDSVDPRQPQELRSAPATNDKMAPRVEPLLREPVPSFQSLERGGAMEYMQSLGQFPTQRLKLRVKQYEPPKRYVQTKLTQGMSEDGAAKRGQGRTRQSESCLIEPATVTPKVEIPNSTDSIKSETGQYSLLGKSSTAAMAEAPLHTSPTPAPTTQIPHLPPSHPNISITSTYSGNAPYESLRETIDAALARAIEKKQPSRGLAIQKLYEEGFTNPNLAELLDAILSQKASEAQQLQFQTYIRLARKEFKAEKNHSRRSSTTIGANAIVESIENSPVSRLLATPTTRPHSSHHTLLNHLAQPLFHQHPSLDHHIASVHNTFHHNNFPDKDTPLASLEGGVPLSPTVLESTTDTMPPKKRAAETNGEGPSKKSKLVHEGSMPNAPASKPKLAAKKPRSTSTKPQANASKSTVSKPTVSKRSASKDDAAPTEEPSAKRVKRDGSAGSTSSALTEMDSDGLKDLEEVATKEVTPRLTVDAPFAKCSFLLSCTHKNAESFLAPPERRPSSPTFVATKDTEDVDAKTGGRPTRTRQPSRRAIEANEVHRQNLPVFTRDDLPAKEVDKIIKASRREHPDYKVEASNIREPTIDHSAKPSPALAGTPTLDLPNIAEQDEEANGVPSATSSDAGDFLVPPPPFAQRISNRNSRVHTPRAASPTKNTRATRNGLKVARVKQSPRKKNVDVTAGIAPAGGNNRVLANAQAEADNNEFCSACGGDGTLVCCDGCPRSFHFSCLDPPITKAPVGEWFCQICVDSRAPQAAPSKGIFSTLLANLEKGNPVAFSLPIDVRTFFEGVETGEAGEFREVDAPLKRGKRARADAEREIADYGTVKEKVILCAACGGNNRNGERQFLPCDYCSLYWHLDCLDPPMANPPAGKDGRPPPAWKCPCHVDTEYLNASRKAHEGATGQRVIKIRRARNARVVDARKHSLHTLHRNNGIIEIELEPSEDEADSPINANVVQRMTEEGVKLDFIQQVLKNRKEEDAGSRRTSATDVTGLTTTTKEAIDGESMAPPPRKRSKSGHSPIDMLTEEERENMRIGAIIRQSLPAISTMASAEREAVLMLAALGTAAHINAPAPSTLTPATTATTPPIPTTSPLPALTTATTTANPVDTASTTATTIAATNTAAVAANAEQPASLSTSTFIDKPTNTTTTTTTDVTTTAPDATGSIDAGMGASTALGSAPNGTIVVADNAVANVPGPEPEVKKSRKEKLKAPAPEPARKSTRARKAVKG